MGIAIFLIICFLFCCGVFDSKERKQMLAKDKRKQLCFQGRIPYEEMSWQERIIYATHNIHLLGQQNQIIDYKRLRDEIFLHIDEIGDNHCMWEYDFNKSIHAILHNDYHISKSSPSDFLLKYAPILIMRHYWVYERDLISTCIYGIKSYEVATKTLKYMMVRTTDVGIKHEIEKMMSTMESMHKKKLEKTHKEQIEINGGFSNVKSGEDYEYFIIFCIKDAGFICEKIGGSGDFGADIIAHVKGKKVVIQCKNYSAPVGYQAVQQVYTAKSIYNCNHACVVSNATFTSQAKIAAAKLGVKMLSHGKIKDYLCRL